MHPDFNAFSVLSKGYACGLGTTGYEAFAILSKGYVCVGAPVVVVDVVGGDSSKRREKKLELDTSLDALLIREDEEILSVITAISRRRH